MRHVDKTISKGLRGIIITLVISSVILIIALSAINHAGNSITTEQADLLRSSLYSAAINGYAVTGRYPTLFEIEQNYGIVINREKYDVSYYSFASNILPDIIVTPVEEMVFDDKADS